MTAVSRERAAKVASFDPGEVVRVRDEPSLSVVVLPTHRACEVPADAPDLGAMCCVPIALVRTPAGSEDGPMRWVEIRDLTREEPD